MVRIDQDRLDLIYGRKVRLGNEFEEERTRLAEIAAGLGHHLSRVTVDDPDRLRGIQAQAKDLATALYHLRGKAEWWAQQDTDEKAEHARVAGKETP